MVHNGSVTSPRRVLLVAAVSLMHGCTADLDPLSSEPTDRVVWRPGGTFEEGPEVVCEAPLTTPFRYEREETARGLVDAAPVLLDEEDPFRVPRRSVVAEDLDDDGDVDLLIARPDGLPLVHINDGTGHFVTSDIFAPVITDDEEHLEVDLYGVADLDGDRLPDLVGSWVESGIFVSYNLGGGDFGPLLTVDPGPVETETVEAQAVTFGDIDADGDLDVLLVTSHVEDDDAVSSPDQIFRNDEGALSFWFSVATADGDGVSSQAAMFTDRDGDGDADLLVLSNAGVEGLGTGFWENRGGAPGQTPTLVERSVEWSADVQMVAMGVDSADLNGDGWLDYCGSDIGPPTCLLSQGGDGYVQGAAAIGVQAPEAPSGQPQTVGWSVEFADLDNDGALDLLHASGYDRWSLELGRTEWPDLLWMGSPQGFALADVGFDDPAPHYGLAAADLDGDGWLEVITAGPPEPPALFRTECGIENWVRIELRGPPENPQGIGARVEVRTPQGSVIREVQGVRASGQSPSSVHMGLGSSQVASSLMVRWPDGFVTEARDLPARRVVTAVHPEG